MSFIVIDLTQFLRFFAISLSTSNKATGVPTSDPGDSVLQTPKVFRGIMNVHDVFGPGEIHVDKAFQARTAMGQRKSLSYSVRIYDLEELGFASASAGR